MSYVFFFFFFSYVLLELVETERDYVRDLGAVVEVGLFSVLLTNTAGRSLWWPHVTKHINSSKHNWQLLSGLSSVCSVVYIYWSRDLLRVSLWKEIRVVWICCLFRMMAQWDHMFYVTVYMVTVLMCSGTCRATLAGWRRRVYLTTWRAKIRLSSGTFTRFLTGIKSMWKWCTSLPSSQILY